MFKKKNDVKIRINKQKVEKWKTNANGLRMLM